MLLPIIFPDNQQTASCLKIIDVSFLTRFGVKGINAAEWLASQEIGSPDRPNTWQPLSTGGIIARLGLTEFLVEDSIHSTIAAQLIQNCQNPPPKVYPVLRHDRAIVLCGSNVNELLLQTCNINFRALDLADHPVILTTMISVAVTIIPAELNGQPFYRIWCDGTFGAYVWRTLVEIATELGGSVIGTEQVLNFEF